MGDKYFDGFFIFYHQLIEIPRFIITRKQKTYKISFSLMYQIVSIYFLFLYSLLSIKKELKSHELEFLKRFENFFWEYYSKQKPNFQFKPVEEIYYIPSFQSLNEIKSSSMSEKNHLKVLNGLEEIVDVKLLESCFQRHSGLDLLKKWMDFISNKTNIDISEETDQKNLVEEFNLQTQLRRELNGRMVMTNYSNKLYFIQDISFSATPLSCFETRKHDTYSFYSYYQSKGITIQNIDQPLFSNGSIPMRDFHNPYISIPLSQAIKTNRRIFLVPELCYVYGFTTELFLYGSLLPFILSHMKSYLLMEDFLFQNKLTIQNKKLLKTAFTHPSCANDYGGTLNTYQRLEFLGDSILEFFISLRLYHIFPYSQEGMLSKLKSCLVCNEFLANLGRTIEIGKYLICIDKEDSLTDKVIADVLESLIGKMDN